MPAKCDQMESVDRSFMRKTVSDAKRNWSGSGGVFVKCFETRK